MMMVYIGGVPGVGKTAIIREAEVIAKKINLRLERVVSTDIMCRLAGVDTVEKLRRLPESVRKKIRPEMNRLIYAQDEEDPLTIRLCDGHFCFFDFTGEQYGVRQIQPWDRERILALSVITASPQVVLRRRLQDVIKRPDRRRDINFLIKEQELETNTALLQAKTIDAPLRFIQSEENKVLAASEILFRFCFYQMLRRKKLHS